MLSLEDMFYGPKEDVWIVKPEKKEEVKKGDPKPPAPVPTALEECFGTFYPFYHPSYTAQPAAPKKPAETKNIVLKVPICCTECIVKLTNALDAVKGFKKVDCDIGREKVTVTVKNDTTTDEVVLESRKAFKKSRLWTTDD